MQGNGTVKSFHGTLDSARRLQVWHNRDIVITVMLYLSAFLILFLHEQMSEAFRIVHEFISTCGPSFPNYRSALPSDSNWLIVSFTAIRSAPPSLLLLSICRCEPRLLITVSKMKLELKGGRGRVWIGGVLQCHYGCVQMSVRPGPTGKRTHTHTHTFIRLSHAMWSFRGISGLTGWQGHRLLMQCGKSASSQWTKTDLGSDKYRSQFSRKLNLNTFLIIKTVSLFSWKMISLLMHGPAVFQLWPYFQNLFTLMLLTGG